MKKNLGIGILGAGFMGQTYARTIATLVEHARLVAVAGGTRAPKLAAEYGIAALPSAQALAEHPEVDVVCIGTPHACHGQEGLAAARGGKHLLIDKPMATTVEACDAILAECAKNHLRCEIMFTQRNRVCNIETKRLLDSRALGALLQLRNSQVVPDGMKTTPAWQLQRENVGILMGHGIHNIDQMRWLTGREIARVFAKVRACQPGYDVDGTADVLLTMDNGLVASVHCSFEQPKPGFPRTGGATHAVCERGLIDSDWYGEMRVSRDGGPFAVEAVQPAIDWAGQGFLDPVRLKTYALTIQGLVDDILEGKPAGGSGWDGRQAVAAATAAYLSSQTGREIELNAAEHYAD